MAQILYVNNRGAPIRVLVSGQLNSTYDDDMGLVQLLHCGVERVVDGDDNEIADNDCSIFCSPNKEILTRDVLSTLQKKVSFQSHPEYYGTRSFIRTKIIKSCIMLSNMMHVANTECVKFGGSCDIGVS